EDAFHRAGRRSLPRAVRTSLVPGPPAHPARPGEGAATQPDADQSRGRAAGPGGRPVAGRPPARAGLERDDREERTLARAVAVRRPRPGRPPLRRRLEVPHLPGAAHAAAGGRLGGRGSRTRARGAPTRRARRPDAAARLHLTSAGRPCEHSASAAPSPPVSSRSKRADTEAISARRIVATQSAGVLGPALRRG